MLDWAAEVVRLAYGVWPSYGGAFALVALLVGLLFAPLTSRSAGSRQQLVALQPDIQRIRAAHAGDPAALQRATTALYRTHGVKLGSSCSLAVLQWAVVVVLYLLVGGFTTLDPDNGGGPRYLAPETPLWQSLRDSEGHLTSWGVDLGRTLFAQASAIGVLSYTVLLIVLIAVTAARARAATVTAAQVVWALISAFVIALILPGAIVLYLVTLTTVNWIVAALTTEPRPTGGRWTTSGLGTLWRPPHRVFQATLREADRLDAQARSDEAATLRLSAINEFSQRSSVDRLTRYAADIRHHLVAAASRQPSGAVAALTDLKRRCPQCVPGDLTSSVVREWTRGARTRGFADDLAAIETTLTGTNQDVLDVLLDTCRSQSRAELNATFCREMTRHLWEHLDRNVRLTGLTGVQGLDGHRTALALLDLVGPARLPRAGQLCALGDLACARGSPAEGVLRYEAAVKDGSQDARERLAYHRAREGHRLLSAGKITDAGRKFAAADMLHKDQEYALSAAITELLSDRGDIRVALDRLEALKVTGTLEPYLALWRAIAHLRQGGMGQARTLLQGLATDHRDSTERWGPLQEGAVLLAVLDNDDQALVEWARRLVRTYGREWLSAGPSDAWPLVGAVARHDQDLLAEMVALVGSPRELPEWVRIAGAHALLSRSVQSARTGQPGAGASDAELAQRLLRG